MHAADPPHGAEAPELQALGLALREVLKGGTASVDPAERLVTRLDFSSPWAMLRALAADMQALSARVPPAQIAIVAPRPDRVWRFHLPRALGQQGPVLAFERRLIDDEPVRACLTLAHLASGMPQPRQARQALLEALVPLEPMRLAPLASLDAALLPDLPADARRALEAVTGWLAERRASPQPWPLCLSDAVARFWPAPSAALRALVEEARNFTGEPDGFVETLAALPAPLPEGAIAVKSPEAMAESPPVAFQLWLDVMSPTWPGGAPTPDPAAGEVLEALCRRTTVGMRWYGSPKDAEGRPLAGSLPEWLQEVVRPAYAGLGGAS